MDDYHWYFVIALILVCGVFLFVFMYTLNRNPKNGLVVILVNIKANTISFYNDSVDTVTIYLVKENTDTKINMIENFDVTEANTVYDEPCVFKLSDLAPGTYNIGYTSSKSSSLAIGVLTINN